MRKYTIVSSKLKRNLYISVVALYSIFSTFIFVSAEYQFRLSRKNQVETKREVLRNSINAHLNTYVESTNQVISLLSENSFFLKSLRDKDNTTTSDFISSLYSGLLKSQSSFITLLDSTNRIIASEGSGIELGLISNMMPLHSIQHPANTFSVDNKDLVYYSLKTLETTVGPFSLIAGQKVNYLNDLNVNSDDDGVILFTAFSPEIPTQPNIFCANGHGSLDSNREEIEKLISELGIPYHELNGQTIRLNERVFSLGEIIQLSDSSGTIVATSYFAKDVSQEYSRYKRNLVKTIAFLILLLFTFLLVIRLFYYRILNAILKFEKTLDEKLHERTKEIIDSNDEMRQVFNSTANGIRIIDNEFNITKVNESFCRLSGIPDSHLNGRKCYEIFPSTSCHTDNCPLERIKSGERIVEQRDIRFKPSGNKIICEYKARPFLGKNGEFLGIIEDFKDITDLEIAEDGILQTKMQFEALMDSMPVGVFIRDFDGNMIYQNSYMDKAFGPFDFEKKNIKYVFPSNQVDRFLEEDKYVEKYGAFIIEEELSDSNGVERTYVTHKFKFSGAKNISLIGGVSIDISKRKRAEHNYYVLSKAIKNAPIGVLITSPQGLIEFVNPEFEIISDRSNEDLLGRTFPPFNEIENSPLKKSIDEALLGRVFQEEANLKIFTSQPNWYSLSVAPVFNRKGSVAHIIFIFDDINQRKEFEREIVIAKTKAEESDRLKTAFLSNLSHEIRTPLNAILGFSSLLNNKLISHEEKQEIPNQLLHHSNILLEIINDLIDISAIETNQLVIKKGECQLNRLLENIFKDFIKTNGKSNLKTFIKLGVAEESFTVLTDSERLSQVIKHLLSNALKFTNSGFVELGYTFKDPGTLLFYVIDSGVGLDEHQKEYIFNPFRQVDDSKTRSYNGLGLGLAIAKNIIERLGGKIWVNSVKNEGTTFFFTLPYIPVRAKFDEVILPITQNADFNWSNKTIMVADDIDSNFRFIQTLIKPTGANLIWAKNGKEAISIVKENNIDLILMDIVMPEMDGFEATKQIKQLKKNIKVICQTAYPSPEHKAAGIECGMDKFLSKPIAIKSMLETINDYISKN